MEQLKSFYVIELVNMYDNKTTYYLHKDNLSHVDDINCAKHYNSSHFAQLRANKEEGKYYPK